jgi:hypothetical protein
MAHGLGPPTRRRFWRKRSIAQIVDQRRKFAACGADSQVKLFFSDERFDLCSRYLREKSNLVAY